MTKSSLGKRRMILWALTTWVCLSLPAFLVLCFGLGLLPSHTNKWCGLRQTVLSSDAGYTYASLGGKAVWTTGFPFLAYGRTASGWLIDEFVLWDTVEDQTPDFPAPSSDSDARLITRQVTVGTITVRASLSKGRNFEDPPPDGEAWAESRWKAIEPLIRRYLENPRRTPGLKLIRNDLQFVWNTGAKVSPVELEVALWDIGMKIGAIPSAVFGFLVLVTPFGKWPVYGTLGIALSALLGSTVLTEIRWRRINRVTDK